MAQPQATPRLVPCINEQVLDLAMTDTTTIILLKSGDVICLRDGNHWKLQ